MFGKILLFILIAVGAGAGYFFVRTHTQQVLSMIPSVIHQKSVQGASTVNPTQPPSAIQNNLSQIQKQISKLSLKDIGSSSPQVQAILQSIQQLPSGEAHDVCQKLCGGYLK